MDPMIPTLIRFPEPVLEALDELAAKLYKSRAEVVREAVLAMLKPKKEPE